MHWRRKWQPTPVFLPGESQGRRSLVGFRLPGREAALAWASLAQRFPASSVLAREGAGCAPALLAPRRPRGSQLRLATQRLPAQPPLPSWPSPCWLTLSDVTHCRRRSAVSDLGSGDSAALPGSLSTKMRCWSAGQRPAPPLCTTEADGCDSGTPAWEPRKAAVPASGLISLDLEPP